MLFFNVNAFLGVNVNAYSEREKKKRKEKNRKLKKKKKYAKICWNDIFTRISFSMRSLWNWIECCYIFQTYFGTSRMNNSILMIVLHSFLISRCFIELNTEYSTFGIQSLLMMIMNIRFFTEVFLQFMDSIFFFVHYGIEE